MSDDLEVRRGTRADRDAVLSLLASSLGWLSDDQHSDFFAWKHERNVFGPSPVWLAVDGDRIAGVRMFLRWKFHRAGKELDAVRAVDTATHPDYRGRGIFTRLTMAAAEELADEGIAFVFNTPNEQSRPGYLKMGWTQLGRVRVGFRPRGLRAIATMLRSRTAADKWGQPTDAFPAPGPALASENTVQRLLQSIPRSSGLATVRSPDYLRWRYGLDDLGYRVATHGPLDAGAVIFRLRQRGQSLEAAICEVLVPQKNHSVARHLIRDVVRATGADYAVAAGRDLSPRRHLIGVRGLGPVFTHRALADPAHPCLRDFQLSLGDVELF